MTPKVLLVDDDEAVLETNQDYLEPLGYDVQSVQSYEQALNALDLGGPWDVVILDEMLHGPGGAASATPLLAEISARAPEARTIVLTGYATEPRIEAAVAAGAWDYIEKSGRFERLLLPLRVRQAVEAARERRLRGATPDEIERELRQSWSQALTEQNRHKKGRQLEQAAHLLFRTMKGLDEVRTNLRNSDEEFDLVVTNNSQDPVLSKEGSLFLVECKNWSKPVSTPELNHFHQKLFDRFGRVKLGIFISVGGFTAGIDHRASRASNDERLILLLDGSAMTEWINSSDRLGWLKDRLQSHILRRV